MPTAALASRSLLVSGGRPPLSVRSPLTRQRIEAFSWSWLLSEGVASVSGQFAPAATPPPAFFGLWLALPGILARWSSNCCDFDVARPAGPTNPRVPPAVTAPPLLEEDGATGAGGAVELPPPPPPQPATTRTPTTSAVETAALMCLWIRCSEPSMPRWSSDIGSSPLSACDHCRPCVQYQPVKRGAANFFPQRWNESRIVFAFVPEPALKVTFTTRRCTPSFRFFGLTRSWIRAAFFVFLTFLTILPSSTKVTVAILEPRIRALNAFATQPVGPSSFAAPGVTRSGSRSCAGWVSVVSAELSSFTHLPNWSQPVTVATLCTAVSPRAVWTEQL